jgi:hypothetical protein
MARLAQTLERADDVELRTAHLAGYCTSPEGYHDCNTPSCSEKRLDQVRVEQERWMEECMKCSDDPLDQKRFKECRFDRKR